MDKETSKKEIQRLVKEFSNYTKQELNSKSENQIKSEFIDPLFEALGWDMRKDAEREERVLKGRADYILKIGHKKALVIEAKKTSVELSEEEGRQAVSYAYHNKIKFAVLTNFKHIRVYHALSNIRNIDKNLLKDDKGYLWIDCENFESQFDRLWILSKESFEKEEINKLLSAKDQRLYKPVDENLLNDLLNIRKWLSTELKSKKNYLEGEKIDEIVQILIDRLIFIRSLEDRSLEQKDFLLNLDSDVRNQVVRYQLFPYLMDKFKEFNKKYDSKLFEEGILDKEGAFSDEVLHKVIKGLYYGTEDTNRERYMFDQIPGDLLGSIYEQYLGTVLRDTEKRVKLENGKGKRKSMGIYYTPSYIVEYIVKNTVGEYIKDKSINEILDVRILDPACGSGSFLVRAFQEVCNVVEEKLKKKEFSNKWLVFKNYETRLNLGQKIQILKNCIYGVDLDEKAVELARLNLLLKLLEDKGQETKKLLLPSLGDTIKCGNSLIDDNSISDKAFKWEAQFSEIFKSGRFDIVIGNPPYVDYSKIGNVKYFNENYQSTKVEGNIVKYNLFQLFIEKSINLLKNKGLFGFINPNTYLSADNALSLRKLILDKTSIKKIVDVSKLKVFKEAATYPVITIFEKGKKEDNKLGVAQISEENEIGPDLKLNLIKQKDFDKDNFNFVIKGNKDTAQIINKIEKNPKLEQFKDIFVWGSSITGFAKHKLKTKKDGYSPLIQTRDIKRYSIDWKKEFIETSIYSNKLTELFKKKKLVIARVTKNIQATIDEKGFFVGKSSIFIPKERELFEYILAILNSELINFYYKTKFETTHMAGGYIRFDIPYLNLIPIANSDKKTQDKLISLVNQMLSLQEKYNDEKVQGNEKDRLVQQIKNVDYEIDEEIYKLYGITAEEKKIIEESMK